MSPLGLKSTVYHGDLCLGEAEVFPSENLSFHFPNNEIRINHLSPPSERCPPLSVLHTISPFSVRCKLEAKSASEQSPLARLHVSCLVELKTAVVLIGDEELHLVAMQSKVEKFPCFWCCPVPIGLYASCLGMLNLRCLSIVFDLDETLIVANTMKSFEDRIEFLQRRIAFEMDALRAVGMKAELKRYWDDKALLKQYLENDQVVDNGQLVKTQFEEVPPLSTNQDRVVRPVIRLPDRNIVLTRINPEIRDTSVLVRLRPAWDDLRSYLTAKGRKRFEVYVCTMAERDYALEMWRLLDPEAHLISSKQLLDRVVCVKPGSRKSLLSVFKDCICHSKMAMVIDDRMNVWEDNDQSRVHVVPAFAPYYAPQAEMANAVPVLCVARNVACNVRGGFFKEFDENLLRRIFEIRYEDELKDLPSAPDVSHYLMSEEPSGVLNGNRELPIPEGMTGAEVERRLNRPDQKLGMVDLGASFVANNPDLRSEPSQQPMAASSNFVPPLMPRPAIALQRPGLLGAAPKDGEIPQPEFERRHLILQQSHDIRNHGSIDVSKPLTHISAATTQRHGGWLVAEEDPGVKHLNKHSLGVIHQFDALPPEKNRTLFTQPHYSVESLIPREKPRNISTVKPEEAYLGDERRRKNHVPSTSSSFSDDEVSRASVSNGEAGTLSIQPSNVSVGVLQEIGRRCSSKVEFTTAINTSMDLQFFVEVFFTGEKIGVGMGRTRKEAQLQAADNALNNLASKYVAYIGSDTVAGIDGDRDKLSHESDNGFLRDIVSPGLDELPGKEAFPSSSTLGQLEHSENSKRLSAIVAGIEELCMTEGLSPVFQDQPPISTSLSKGEHYFQVEIAGQIVGKGTGFSKEEAKLKAAAEALESLKAMVNQPAQKRLSSPRPLQSVPAKRAKNEVSRGSQSVSSS